jgi:hypothetical protein
MKWVERSADIDTAGHADNDLSMAFARWNETMQQLQLKNVRTALVSQIASEAQDLPWNRRVHCLEENGAAQQV